MTVATDIGVGLAAVGAIAAAVSARASARGVALSHRPYVYGERGFSDIERSLVVRLHNDGPGTAVEVCVRLGAVGAEATEWLPSVRAMQAGEIVPPKGADGWPVEPPVGADGPVSDWYIETEFSDIRGARWRLRNDRSSSESATPRRVRTRAFQLWHPVRPDS